MFMIITLIVEFTKRLGTRVIYAQKKNVPQIFNIK